MVELDQYDIDHALKVKDTNIRGTVAHGKRIAKLLMNVFFDKTEFREATLSPLASGKKLLIEDIIKAIISKYEMCKSASFSV
jgi:hypothetical protein